jgi:hypothetical protein
MKIITRTAEALTLRSPRSSLGVASIALIMTAAACGSNDAGGGFVTESGDCIVGRGDFQLQPGQAQAVGGADMNISWSGGRADVLIVKNEGDGEATVKGSDGSVSYNDEPDHDTGGDITWHLGNSRQSFWYEEEGQRVDINLSLSSGDIVVMDWAQTCPDD